MYAVICGLDELETIYNLTARLIDTLMTYPRNFV